MCDYIDDFDGEFEDDGFMDGFMDDNFEDTYGEHLDEFEPEEALIEDNPVRDEPDCDRFTGRDALILGGAMGWAYEEGLDEGRWKRRERRNRREDDIEI